MYIKRMQIARFRHIEDAEIGPLGPPPESSDLVALVGPNGAGKSSILELLSHALSNSWSLTWSIRRTFPASSFEIDIGLTETEFRLVEERLDAPSGIRAEALEYLRTHRAYSRSFAFEGGEYEANSRLHNQAHDLVTQALKDHHGRALGFFLRSDRSYPVQKYDRRKLVQNHKRTEKRHVWGLAFNTSDIQYQDMYDFLVEEQYHYDRRLGAHLRRERSGSLEAGEVEPGNPMQQYDDLLGRLFPGYSFAEAPADVPDNLYVTIPSGERIAFQDLSSGEKEVFFILSFFLRSDVRDAIVVLDEPELHLHPELGRLLIRTMQEIRPGNQVWVGTHSGEIIDEAGRDRLFFLERDEVTRAARVTPATEDSEAKRILRSVFGYSGYLGVARAMVFTEGTGASLDRKIFSRLFSAESGAARVIPSGGSDSLPRINSAVLQILNATFGSCEFFLIRDRDYLRDDEAEAMVRNSEGHFWVLARNQIENYLLDPSALASVETEILGYRCTREQAQQTLEAAARQIAGETLREMLAFRMNRVFSPQDFSMDRILQGQECLTADGAWLIDPLAALRRTFTEKVEDARESLETKSSEPATDELFQSCSDLVRDAATSDRWKYVMPGKRLLEVYASLRGHPSAVVPALTNSLVKQFSSSPGSLDGEFRDILAAIMN